MEKWFDSKLEKSNLRRHTIRRIRGGKPFGFTNNFFRKLSITNWLIILNVVIYLLVIILIALGVNELTVLSVFALQANGFFSGAFWTLLSSMFTHIWLPHLFFNMISLFFVGNFLEKIIGRKRFLWFYVISGLFAGFFYAILSFYFGVTELGARIFIDPNAHSVGASGAIFGIAGLLSILTPMMKVYLIAGPIIAIIIQSFLSILFPNAASLGIINFLVTFYIFFSIFSIFSFNPIIRRLSIPIRMHFWLLPLIAIIPLIIIGLFIQLPIGNTAHLGGLIAGLTYGQYLKKKYRKKINFISKYFNR